mgnify:CR=1 FL=1
MDRLKAVKIHKLPQIVSEYEYIQDEVQAYFPQSKYFQIHFQHCHENAEKVQQELDALKKHVIKVEEKLEQIMKMLDQCVNND